MGVWGLAPKRSEPDRRCTGRDNVKSLQHGALARQVLRAGDPVG